MRQFRSGEGDPFDEKINILHSSKKVRAISQLLISKYADWNERG
jgi:hypothetical protein